MINTLPHTPHRSTAGKDATAVLANQTFLGMPGTNFGHHLVPAGLITPCVRNQLAMR